jgi:hypothetical protein
MAMKTSDWVVNLLGIAAIAAGIGAILMLWFM